MRHIRAVVSMKQPWIGSPSSFSRITGNETTRDRWFVAPSSSSHLKPPSRSIHSSEVIKTTAGAPEPKKGFLMKTLSKIGLPDRTKFKRHYMGHLLYEDIVSNINYANFFADLKLPDTFYSWFVVMELHLWMLMLRYMAEGETGREIRNIMVEAMWTDVNRRKSEFKNANPAILKKQINELSQQFNAAIIGYDEGIMSDDKILAGALWRRMFQGQGNDPTHVEKMVVYVRKQIYELDRMPGQELMLKKSTQWLDYRNP